MRTTVDLPESLVCEAMEWSHQKTKTAVIRTALEDLIRKNKIQELRKFRGKIDLSIDLDTIRNRK